MNIPGEETKKEYLEYIKEQLQASGAEIKLPTFEQAVDEAVKSYFDNMEQSLGQQGLDIQSYSSFLESQIESED